MSKCQSVEKSKKIAIGFKRLAIYGRIEDERMRKHLECLIFNGKLKTIVGEDDADSVQYVAQIVPAKRDLGKGTGPPTTSQMVSEDVPTCAKASVDKTACPVD